MGSRLDANHPNEAQTFVDALVGWIEPTFLTLLGAVAFARLIQSLLFNVTPLDPLVYAGVVLLFSVVATLACLVPSLRASRIDPVAALQQGH